MKIIKNVEFYDLQKMSYLVTQMQNLYLRDIIARNNLPSNTAIGEVMDVIVSGISTLTNLQRISDTFAGDII